jgi:hypothetical protein
VSRIVTTSGDFVRTWRRRTDYSNETAMMTLIVLLTTLSFMTSLVMGSAEDC